MLICIFISSHNCVWASYGQPTVGEIRGKIHVQKLFIYLFIYLFYYYYYFVFVEGGTSMGKLGEKGTKSSP